MPVLELHICFNNCYYIALRHWIIPSILYLISYLMFQLLINCGCFWLCLSFSWTSHSMWETGSTGIWGLHCWFSSTIMGNCKRLFYSYWCILISYYQREDVLNKRKRKIITFDELVGLQWHDSIGFWKISPWFQVCDLSVSCYALPFLFSNFCHRWYRIGASYIVGFFSPLLPPIILRTIYFPFTALGLNRFM